MGMSFINVLNAKIVDIMGEHDGSPAMMPLAGGGGCLIITSAIEILMEVVISNFSRLSLP